MSERYEIELKNALMNAPENARVQTHGRHGWEQYEVKEALVTLKTCPWEFRGTTTVFILDPDTREARDLASVQFPNAAAWEEAER